MPATVPDVLIDTRWVPTAKLDIAARICQFKK